MADPTPTPTRDQIRALSDPALRQLEDGLLGPSSTSSVSDATARLIYDELAARKLSTISAEQRAAAVAGRGVARPTAGFFPPDGSGSPGAGAGTPAPAPGGSGVVLVQLAQTTAEALIAAGKSGGINHFFKGPQNDQRELVPLTGVGVAGAAIATGVIGPGATVTTPTSGATVIGSGVGDGIVRDITDGLNHLDQQSGPPSGFVEVPGPTPVSLPGAAIVGGAIGLNPELDQPGGVVSPPKPAFPAPPVDARGNRLPPGAFLDAFFNRNKPDP